MSLAVGTMEGAPGYAGTPSLELRGVGKSFGQVRALTHVDFAAHSGELHAIVGDNGAGKSTALKIMCGMYHSDTGDMLIDGERIAMRDARLRGAGLVAGPIEALAERGIGAVRAFADPAAAPAGADLTPSLDRTYSPP